MTSIALHIERLVLDGIPLGGQDPQTLRIAVEAELTRLLSQNGLAAPLHTGGALHGVMTPAIRMQRGEGQSFLGRQIAGALYGGMGR